MSPRPPEPPDFPASQLFLRRLAFSLVRDEAHAEDLVQDTWTAWIEHRPSGVAEPRAWLARVLRNRAFNLKRGERRRAEREELAGRPDPSAPEVDGTLEAQAQLIEALRKLEEPYRSTLVERYYHDLSPSEISSRSGTPLNTIKARLLRGLARLREEMDRRYGGDRRAWCHWLTVMGAPAPIAVPHGTPGTPQGAPPLAGVGGGGGMSLLGWLAVAGAIAVGAVLKSGLGREPRGERPATDTRRASVPAIEPIESAEHRRVPVESEETARSSATAPRRHPEPLAEPPEVLAPPATAASPITVVRDSFDWPQYGGGPEHDSYRKREDEISAPRVLWFVPGCAGQPTLEGGDLYTGGGALLRLNADTGAPTAYAYDLMGITVGGEIGGEKAKEDTAVQLASQFEQLDDRAKIDVLRLLSSIEKGEQSGELSNAIAPAPVVTRDRVFARRGRDGGVSAFDRKLGEELWRWDSGWDTRQEVSRSTRVPLCLTDGGIVLVAQQDQLVALRAKDGREAWRYQVNGAVEMVPAASGDRVFFGTDRGLFVALSASTGEKLWQIGAGGFGAMAPVVAAGRVFVAEVPGPWQSMPDAGRKLRALDARTGTPLWDCPFSWSQEHIGLGVDEGKKCLVTFESWSVQLFDLGRGTAWFAPQRQMRFGQLNGNPRGTPAVVGKSLVVAEQSRLWVFQLEGEPNLRWSFQLPDGAEIEDFVATGRRIYVATSIGLFCIADDPTQAPRPGYRFTWKGNPREAFTADEDEESEQR